MEFLLYHPPALFFIQTLVALVALALAAYTDLRARIVPNALVLAAFIAGVALGAANALLHQDPFLLAVPLLVALATFLAGYGLWRLGVWAGGDVKLFTALAVLLPVNPALITHLFPHPLLSPIAQPVFPLSLFIFSVFAAFPIGMALSIRGIWTRPRLRKDFSDYAKKNAVRSLWSAAAIAGAEHVLLSFGQSVWWTLPALLALALLPRRIGKAATILLFASAIWLSAYPGVLLDFALVLATIVALALALKLFSISRSEILVVDKKITALAEGDIPAETIAIDRGRVRRVAPLSLSKTLKYLNPAKIHRWTAQTRIKGEIVASHRSAAGVTSEQVHALKKLVREKKLANQIRVKLSTPFVPAVLVAFLLLNLAGDLLWHLLGL